MDGQFQMRKMSIGQTSNSSGSDYSGLEYPGGELYTNLGLGAPDLETQSRGNQQQFLLEMTAMAKERVLDWERDFVSHE